MKMYNKAYHIFFSNFGFNNPNVALALTHKGGLFYELEEYGNALVSYQNAIIADVDKFSDTNSFINPSVKQIVVFPELIDPLFGKAKAFQGLYKKTKDIKYLEAAHECNVLLVKMLDRLRSQLREESKFIIAENTRIIYSNAIGAAFKLYLQTNDENYLNLAFSWSEKK